MRFFEWSDEVNKKSQKWKTVVQMIIFLAGVLMVLLPVILETISWQKDLEEYQAMADQYKALEEPTPMPEPTAMIPASNPTVQPTTEPTPEPTSEPEPIATAAPDLSPAITEAPTSAPTPEATFMPTQVPEKTPHDLPPAIQITESFPDETEKPSATRHPSSPMPSKKPEVSDKKNPTVSPNSSSPYPTHTMPKQEPPVTTAPPTEPPQSSAEVDLSACLSQNRDFIAWLTIPGTPIDYPVVRSNNTEHYLTHMFSGKESKLGTLFSLRSSNYQSPSKNIAIYGHHLSQSTAMFSTLMRYKNASYCAGHSTIQLDSLYGSRNYRIFAVVNMSVSDWDASTASFSSNESFLYFVNRARRSALYDTGVQVNEDDHILTLITCDRSYGGATGRLLVMAVQQ